MPWDPSQGERRRYPRQSRDDLIERMRQLTSTMDDFRRDVDTLNDPARPTPWQPRGQDKKPDES